MSESTDHHLRLGINITLNRARRFREYEEFRKLRAQGSLAGDPPTASPVPRDVIARQETQIESVAEWPTDPSLDSVPALLPDSERLSRKQRLEAVDRDVNRFLGKVIGEPGSCFLVDYFQSTCAVHIVNKYGSLDHAVDFSRQMDDWWKLLNRESGVDYGKDNPGLIAQHADKVFPEKHIFRDWKVMFDDYRANNRFGEVNLLSLLAWRERKNRNLTNRAYQSYSAQEGNVTHIQEITDPAANQVLIVSANANFLDYMNRLEWRHRVGNKGYSAIVVPLETWNEVREKFQQDPLAWLTSIFLKVDESDKKGTAIIPTVRLRNPSLPNAAWADIGGWCIPADKAKVVWYSGTLADKSISTMMTRLWSFRCS